MKIKLSPVDYKIRIINNVFIGGNGGNTLNVSGNYHIISNSTIPGTLSLSYTSNLILKNDKVMLDIESINHLPYNKTEHVNRNGEKNGNRCNGLHWEWVTK